MTDTPPLASRLRIPPGNWPSLLACLCSHFAHISPEQWRSRFARGRVLDAAHRPLSPEAACRPGQLIHYFREVDAETPIPFTAAILYQDEHLLVADKPHFLPVTPSGQYVTQTLLHQLIARTGNPQLTPLHRLDRGTAGLVLLSVNPTYRARYHALFSTQQITKQYQAIAAPLPQHTFPHVHRSRLVAGEPFFRMREVSGAANSQTRIDVLERHPHWWRYALNPSTGKKHQLRVHMAALGAPIAGDDFYPQLGTQRADFAAPLQLLASALSFCDPVTGKPRQFVSQQTLTMPT